MEADRVRRFKEGYVSRNDPKRNTHGGTRSDKPNRTYKAPKGTLDKIIGSIEIICDEITERLHKSGKKILRLGAVGLVGVTLFNVGNKIHDNIEYQKDKDSIGISEALKDGETLESLGISEESESKFEELRKESSNFFNYNNEELIEVSSRIADIQEEILKEKISKVLDIETDKIILCPSNTINGEYYPTCVKCESKGIYSKKTILNVIGERKISDSIAEYIELNSTIRDIGKKNYNDDFSRDEVIEQCINALSEINKMSAAKIYLDNNGNIVKEVIRRYDYEQEQNNTSSAKASVYNIDTDLER